MDRALVPRHPDPLCREHPRRARAVRADSPEDLTKRRWAEWRERLAENDPLATGELVQIAGEVRSLLVHSVALQREWSPVGIDVRVRPLQASGGHGVRGEHRQVYVRADEPRQRQRFTVAHELAHLLLAGTALAGGGAEAEQACDVFAQHTLMPPAEVERWLEGRSLHRPEDVLRLCAEFGISIGMALRWLSHERTPEVAFVGARYRGHRRRPQEHAFRVEASAAPEHLYVPRGQRLASLGVALDAEALRAAPRTTIADEEQWVSLRTRRDSARHGSHHFTGPAAWEACVLGGTPRALLLAIDVSRLRPGRSTNAIYA